MNAANLIRDVLRSQRRNILVHRINLRLISAETNVAELRTTNLGEANMQRLSDLCAPLLLKIELCITEKCDLWRGICVKCT